MAEEIITIPTENGETSAYLARPESPNGKAVIVIQEYWGLNDHIRDIARRYASEGFLAAAPDLYRGKTAETPAAAAKLMSELKLDEGVATIRATVNELRRTNGLDHFGITGFCMGGTYALRAACLVEGISAAVPFYGDIPEEPVLKRLRVPTIFISATKDGWINTEKVSFLEDAAERYELPVESVKYEADHAFFNDTRPEVYVAEAAQDAWALAVGFFEDKL
ncbi:MAG TPA: dienelactone hydrolase family protein [Pyrinomonadaceae bacterium]|nr:dienelactone hydrolase family protein [Pyrinomonadaceae bacterium]